MGKRSRNKIDEALRRRAAAAGEETSSAGAVQPPRLGLRDTIRPALELSELVKNHARIVDKSALNETLAAHQRMVDQVRASMRLPAVEQTAAEAIPAQNDRKPTLLPPQDEQTDHRPATATIASAHDLGRLVREAREERGLSQQAFADLVGVGRRFISELENGKPTVEFGKVLQVAAATGIDVLARHRR